MIIYEITAVLSGQEITSRLFLIFFNVFLAPEIRVDFGLEGRAPSRPFGHVPVFDAASRRAVATGLWPVHKQ